MDEALGMQPVAKEATQHYPDNRAALLKTICNACSLSYMPVAADLAMLLGLVDADNLLCS